MSAPSAPDISFIHPKGSEAFPIGGEGVLIEWVQALGGRVLSLGMRPPRGLRSRGGGLHPWRYVVVGVAELEVNGIVICRTAFDTATVVCSALATRSVISASSNSSPRKRTSDRAA